MSEVTRDSLLERLADSPQVVPLLPPNVGERYELGRVLGEGGFGVVYEAFDRQRGERVALKTLRGASAKMLLRLKHEFRTLVDLDHPNLVTLHELAGDERRLFFTMECVEGAVSFAQWAQRGESELRRAMAQVIDGLAALHAQGIIHRDVKPSNVLVDMRGRVVLVDFGLAHEVDRNRTIAAGTPAYMAPEQHDDVPLTPAVDAYSLGAMLFECLAGRLPFVGSVQEVVVAKQTRDAPPLRELCPGTPEDLAELVDGLLKRDPTERPQLNSLASNVPPPKDGTFVGREAPLLRLHDAFRTRGQLIEIIGASGIGKTALMNHFVSELMGTMVLRGRCHPREEIAYKAFDGVMDELSKRIERSPDLERALPQDTHALCALFPVMRSIVPSPVSGSPPPTRERGIAAFRELFARLGDQIPVVIAIDDTQWGDADSATLLTELLREPDPPRILVVTTRRSDETGALMDRLERGYEAGTPMCRCVVALEPLSHEESGRLATMLACDEARTQEVIAQSAGHPLFIRELAMQQAGGSLNELMGRRIDGLQPGAKETLNLLSVAGYPLPRGILATMTSAESFDDLATSGLVRHGPAGTRVYHDRVAEIVRSQLDAASRAQRHRTLADTWIATAGDSDRIAKHLSAAGDSRTPFWLLKAARHAARTLGFGHAAELYRELLGWVERGAEVDASKLEIHAALADALTSSGQPGQAVGVYLAAAELVSGQEAARLRCFGAAQATWSGNPQRAWEIFGGVFRDLGTPFRQTMLGSTAQVAFNLTSTMVRRRLPKARRRDQTRLDALWTAFGATAALDPVQSLVLVSKYGAEVARSGDALHRFRALALDIFKGALLTGASGHAERRVRLDAGYVETAGDPHALLTLHCFRTVVDSLGFRPVASIAACIAGWDHAVEYGLEWTFEGIGVRQMLGSALEATGDVIAREAFGSRVLAEANERDHLYLWHTGAIHLAAVARIRGQLVESRRRAEDVRVRWLGEFKSHHRGWQLADVVGDALAEGDAERAYRLTTKTRGNFVDRVVTMPHFAMFEDLWRARAAIAYAASDRAQRRDCLRVAERVRRAYRGEPASYCLAISLALEAGIASVRGEHALAHETLRAMLRVTEESGCVMLLALVRKELGIVDDNPALTRRADEFFKRSGISDPRVPARLFLPGVFEMSR